MCNTPIILKIDKTNLKQRKMKSRIEILAESMSVGTGTVRVYMNEPVITPEQALEAMKIAMRQAFEAAKKKYWATRHDIDVYNDFDEYLNELEGCKDE